MHYCPRRIFSDEGSSLSGSRYIGPSQVTDMLGLEESSAATAGCSSPGSTTYLAAIIALPKDSSMDDVFAHEDLCRYFGNKALAIFPKNNHIV